MKPARSESRPELLEELVASIKATGLIQPLIVRPVPGFPHQFEVVAGERRLKAAQLAGLTDVPAIIRDFNDQEALAISLIENIQREELSPADEARALHRLIEEFALTHEQVAHAIGRSRAAVSNLLRLLDLPAEVTTMLETQTISMGHARALLGLAGRRGARARRSADCDAAVERTRHRIPRTQGDASARRARPSASLARRHQRSAARPRACASNCINAPTARARS